MNLSFLLILAGIFIAIPSVINKQIARSRLHGATYTFGYSAFQALLCLPLLVIEPRLPTDIVYWLLFVFSAVVFGVSMLLIFESYKSLDVSVVSVVQRFNIVIIAIIAILFLDEQPSLLRLGGLGLILLSSVLLTIKRGKINLSGGVWLVFGSTFFSALAAILDKKLLGEMSAFSYAPLNALTIALLFLTSRRVRSEIPLLFKINIRGLFVSALFGSLSWIMYLFVLKNTDISATYPIYKSLSLITPVILGIIFLRETKDLRKKIAATLLGVMGVIFTTLSV